MGPDVEIMVDVVGRYIQGMPLFVLFVCCRVVLHCHGEQKLACPFSLAPWLDSATKTRRALQ